MTFGDSWHYFHPHRFILLVFSFDFSFPLNFNSSSPFLFSLSSSPVPCQGLENCPSSLKSKQTDKKQVKQTLKSYAHLKPTVAEDCNIQMTDEKHSISPDCSCGVTQVFGRLSSPMFIGKATLIPCF